MCSLVVILGAVAPAAAADGVRVELEGDLPFTADELFAAIAARTALGVGPTVRIAAAGDDVRLVRGSESRVVPLGARTGAAAARVVALGVLDLALDEAAPPALPPPPAAAVGVAAAPTRPAPALHAAVYGGLVKGAGEPQPLSLSLSLDVTAPLGGRLRGAVGVGWTRVPTRNEGRISEVTFDAWPLRVGAGVAIGPVELYAGPVVEPYSLRVTVRSAGVLLGGSAWGRAGVPLPGGFRVMASGGIDAFARQVVVESELDPALFETPRVAFWFGVGVGYEVRL